MNDFSLKFTTFLSNLQRDRKTNMEGGFLVEKDDETNSSEIMY